jgi:hypothetical protein
MTIPELLARTVKRKFGTWQKCEGIRSKLIKAVGTNAVDVAKLTTAYVSTALPFIPQWVYSKLSWKNTLLLYSVVVRRLEPKSIPLLSSSTSKDGESPSWDYDGRTRIYMTHTLAKAYGWAVEYIENLDLDYALSLLQEIWTDEHLEREFSYSLSEIAYPYNPSSKKSTFKPMSRPYWMLAKVKAIKTFQIPKTLMPAGVSNDEMAQELVQKFKEHQAKVSQTKHQ